MNNKNLNCHPERVEGSLQIHISSRDITENAKLNHEIAEEVGNFKKHISLSCQCSTLASRWLRKPYLTWILRSSRSMTRMYVLLSIITLLPTLAQAETCTATPDCASLGYTETSCPDGGVKCPWNTNLMYCCKKCAPSCEVKTCQIGDVLYGDKKCYTCLANALPDQIPIGVVFNYGKIVALNDLGSMDKGSAISACNSYSVGGVSGWYLPNNDELLAIYNNINAVQTGLQSGGSKLVSTAYWSSSFDGSHFIVNPVSGSTSYDLSRYSHYIRPVLAF